MPLPKKAEKQTREEVLRKLDPDPVFPRGSGAAVARAPSLSSRPCASERDPSLIELFFANRSGAAVSRDHSARAQSSLSCNPIDTGKRKRSVVEGDGGSECLHPEFGPDTWEVASVRSETACKLARDRLNYQRAKEACRPYRDEFDIVQRRITQIGRAHDLISRQLLDIQTELRNSVCRRSKINKKDIAELRHLYMLELIQKEEELMRLRDRAREIQKIIIDIYKKYEIRLDLTENVFLQGDILGIPRNSSRCNYGGAKNKTEKHKAKRSHENNRTIKRNRRYKIFTKK